MHTILIIIALAVVAISMYVQLQHKDSPGQVVGQSITATPTTGTSPTPSVTNTVTPVPTHEPTNAPTQSAVNASIDFYVYPGSTIINTSSSSLTLQSSDPPDAVTNWYKEKIKAEGMNAKSFVQTSTNGTVHNELVAAGNGKKILVSIKKNPDQSMVRIDVSL